MSSIPTYACSNGISETMKSIRWLLNKHLKNIDFSHEGTDANKGRDHVAHDPITLGVILEVQARLRDGQSDGEVSKAVGVTKMSIMNIRRKLRRYKDLPDEPQLVEAWYEKKRKPKAERG